MSKATGETTCEAQGPGPSRHVHLHRFCVLVTFQGEFPSLHSHPGPRRYRESPIPAMTCACSFLLDNTVSMEYCVPVVSGTREGARRHSLLFGSFINLGGADLQPVGLGHRARWSQVPHGCCAPRPRLCGAAAGSEVPEPHGWQQWSCPTSPGPCENRVPRCQLSIRLCPFRG